MFNNHKLHTYTSSFKELDIKSIKVNEGDEEDVSILFCIAEKDKFSCIEEFYAAILKIEYSYQGNSEVLDDFINAIEESEIASSSFSEASRCLGEWNLNFAIMDDWLKSVDGEVDTYTVNQEDGCSEFLFENKELYVFAGISI